jgi:Tol biopolymer transport system component
MFFRNRYLSKKRLIFPGVLILIAAIACTADLNIMEPTRIPDIAPEIDASETAQPMSSPDEVGCPESRLAGLVFGYSDQNNQSLWQVGTCGEYIQLAVRTYVQISSDGSQILFTEDNDIWVVDLLTRERKNMTNTPDRIEVNPRWWPGNDDLVVFGSWELGDDLGPTSGYLSMISIDGGEYRVLADDPSNTDAALQPNGSIIAYDLGDTVWLYHLDLDKRELFDVGLYGLNILKGMRVTSPSWSPDGKKLSWWVSGVFSPPLDGSTALAVFELEDGNVELLHPYSPIGTGGGLPAPIWSPDGNWLAVRTLSEAHKIDLWVISTDGNEEYHLGFASNPVWKPDSNALIFKALSDDRVKMTEVGDWTQQFINLPPGSVPVDWLGVISDFFEESQ